MTDGLETALKPSEANARASLPAGGRGWYLYGITRLPPREEATLPRPADGGEPLQTLRRAGLAAVVRPVALAEFNPETLRARLGDAAWLGAMVRSHNEVIAAIHRERAILPAKFGSVYAAAADLTAALEQAHDSLAAQLERLTGCDEWGVHVYADRPATQRRIASEHPSMQQLERELATASPGRGYFLRRKLADQLAAATEQALADLADAAYRHLLGWAVAGQANPPARPADGASDEREILRAAFLVRRAAVDRFLAEVRSIPERWGGARCEASGPWPPYSFAASASEEAR